MSEELANALINLIGNDARQLVTANRVEEMQAAYIQQADSLVQWEEHIKEDLAKDANLTDTERQAIVSSRIGQGRFKSNVSRIETRCRITKVDRMEHLRASHLKPWRDSKNYERLDGENGLLLTPSIDHLFDRGFISFEDGGKLLVSPVAHKPSLEKIGVPTSVVTNVGSFTDGQKKHLDFHRENVFLERR